MNGFNFRSLDALCRSLDQLNGRSTFVLSKHDGCYQIDGLEHDLVSLYNLISLYTGAFIFALNFDNGTFRIDCFEKGL